MRILRKIKDGIRLIPTLLEREIWSSGDDDPKNRRARSFALLRILIIVWRGINGNKLFSQAAALSYYSLIGLGPLLAIGIMISSFLLKGDEQDNVIVEKLSQALIFVAPPVSEWDLDEDASTKGETKETNEESTESAPSTAEDNEGVTKKINPSVINFIDQIVKSARSGTVGVVGSVALIVIVIQLITSIEKTFNGIWGVKRGRSWAQRIISYWTIASLGAVLSITAVTVLSASAAINLFNRFVPGVEYEDINTWAGPVISILLLTLVLAVFNRFFPHTSVHWRAAFYGGFIGSLLMLANHSLSFLYVHKVLRDQSLYGSVGIIPVLMFGLYLFWLIVLVSCQVAYAVQNANNLTNEEAWSNISPQTRESLALSCFLYVARKFLRYQEPPSTTEIANQLRVPAQLMNNCLSQLTSSGWIRPIEPNEKDRQAETRFQPGLPLDQKTLGDFHRSLSREGNNQGAHILGDVEPLLQEFQSAFVFSGSLDRSIAEVLREDGETKS
ncbi:MAG: YihY/virulence factor BrkB family protein [Verrucomicrobiota bacterium]